MKDESYGILRRFFLVSLGAVPGGLCRWLISQDLLSNLLGVLILGFFSGIQFRDRYKIVIAIGFCGSCTTFSSWMVNIIKLIDQGYFLAAIYSLLLNLLLGFLVLSIAFYFGKKIRRSMLPQ